MFRMHDICLRKEVCACEKACWLASRLITRAWKRMYSELFISEVKSDLLYGIQGKCQFERENGNKRAFTLAKACTQKRDFMPPNLVDI